MTGCIAIAVLFVFVLGGLLNCLLFFPFGILWGFPLFILGLAILWAIAKGARA